MPRWSGRGQVEPLAALAAVLAVTAGMVVYADVLDERVPTTSDRDVAETTVERVATTLRTTGVADPGRLDTARATIPAGWTGNLTLRAGGKRWTRGPTPPAESQRATRRLSVAVAPMELRPGQLRVVIWR